MEYLGVFNLHSFSQVIINLIPDKGIIWDSLTNLHFQKYQKKYSTHFVMNYCLVCPANDKWPALKISKAIMMHLSVLHMSYDSTQR